MNTKEIINAVAKEIEDKGGIRQVFLCCLRRVISGYVSG